MAAAKKSPKKTVKKLTKKIVIPLYDQLLIVSNSFDAMHALLEKDFRMVTDPESMKGLAGAAWSIECEDGGVVFLLVADTLRTLCHESVHSAWHILDYARIELAVDNHEALAYLTDWIFDASHKALKL